MSGVFPRSACAGRGAEQGTCVISCRMVNEKPTRRWFFHSLPADFCFKLVSIKENELNDFIKSYNFDAEHESHPYGVRFHARRAQEGATNRKTHPRCFCSSPTEF